MRLLSVNTGLPRDVSWQGRTVHTGIWKHARSDRVLARRTNLDGDGQGDLAGHGGEQRAVLVYQRDSYEHWRRHFGWDEREYGLFGENLTVDGLPDDEVCIGDRYRIGEAEFEVSQPRVTCYRVGLRTGRPQLPALLVGHQRPGFYLRVLTEGHIQAGDQIVRTRTGQHALSVAETDALLYLPGRDPATLRRALDIPALSPGWRESFRELLEAAPPPPPAWPGFRPLRVARVVRENDTVTSIHLASPDDVALPVARAGQYVTLRLEHPALVRSYSLSSAPGDDTYRITVKDDGRASGHLNREVRPGTTIDVAAPRGDFVLALGSGPVLLVSAGIGLTPVLSMLHELAATGSDREVWWLHATRSPGEHTLAAEAHELLTHLPNGREHVFYSAAGRLTKDRLAALGIPADAEAYVCGPVAFMADMTAGLATLGVTNVHTEQFSARAPLNPGLTGEPPRQPHEPLGPPGTGPLVTFARSGLTVPFGRSTVLELAEACDVPTRWSCRTGVCHNCVTPLLSGSVTYTPEPLEPPAKGQMLICCAQPRTDLVLDL